MTVITLQTIYNYMLWPLKQHNLLSVAVSTCTTSLAHNNNIREAMRIKFILHASIIMVIHIYIAPFQEKSSQVCPTSQNKIMIEYRMVFNNRQTGREKRPSSCRRSNDGRFEKDGQTAVNCPYCTVVNCQCCTGEVQDGKAAISLCVAKQRDLWSGTEGTEKHSSLQDVTHNQ